MCPEAFFLFLIQPYTLKNHQTTTQETMQPSPSGQ